MKLIHAFWWLWGVLGGSMWPKWQKVTTYRRNIANCLKVLREGFILFPYVRNSRFEVSQRSLLICSRISFPSLPLDALLSSHSFPVSLSPSLFFFLPFLCLHGNLAWREKPLISCHVATGTRPASPNNFPTAVELWIYFSLFPIGKNNLLFD